MNAPCDSPAVPSLLRDRILRDLPPVRRLRPPWRRSIALLPVALSLLAIAFWSSSLRRDAGAVGPVRLWGLSGIESLFGILIVALALRESVPGRQLSRKQAWGVTIAPVLFVLGVAWLTWSASPTVVPPGQWLFYQVSCFTGLLILGLPGLILAGTLVSRGFPLRPGLVGALCGLASGLITDAGWRTTCEASDPGHVVSAHLAAIVALTLLGATIGGLVAMKRDRRRLLGPRNPAEAAS